LKFAFIAEHRKRFSVQLMCALFSVSCSGFYAWSKRGPSQREIDDARISAHIKALFAASRDTYGYRRIQSGLAELGEFCCGEKVLRLMRQQGVKPKTRRLFKVTTDSRHNKLVHENHLARQFNVSVPNHRWVSDISYIRTTEGWLYLAVVIDLFSRKVVGWAMHRRMQDELVMNALKMALFRRKIASGLLLHSDRGSQYASDAMQRLLVRHGIECSMSRKGNCWDNAVAESFFRSLKTECVYHQQFQNRDEAKKVIFDYIEVFYNRQRKHSYLGYQSPEQYEAAANL
jgi:transposase InsO family protein